MSDTLTPESARIRTIVDWFVRSDYFGSWQSAELESGAYSRSHDKRDRYERCYQAAENGADGSTHGEHITDMRSAASDWLRDRHRGRLTEFYWRLDSALSEYFDRLESWHERNGSLDQEIG